MRRGGAWSGVAAVSLLALLCMVTVSVRSSWEDATRAVTLEAPLALVDLQPEPAEHSLKPIDFKRNKHDIVRASARFSACVAAAATVDQGVWCMGQLLTVLPQKETGAVKTRERLEGRTSEGAKVDLLVIAARAFSSVARISIRGLHAGRGRGDPRPEGAG